MKHNAILRIILFSITIVVLLAILAAGLTLRRWEWRLNPLAASPEESMAAVPAEEGTASRDSAVTLSSSQVREMEINWAAGSILIQPADVQEITISESAVSDAANAMRWRHSGSKLAIDFCENTRLKGFGINVSLRKDLTILVPRDFALDSLEVNAASAKLKVQQLTIREVDIDTASGECEFTDCAVDELDVDTASGDIRFQGTLKALDCEAASACVYAELDNVPSRVSMDSMSGSLNLTLPEDAGFTLSMDTTSGKFTSDFATTSQNGNHICGNGGCLVKMNAMSGDVSIHKAHCTAHDTHETEHQD